jgi:hypothetical protein
MSELKHMPGLWSVEPHGDTVALYAGRDDQHHGLRLMNLDDGDANFAANARLIAAAPDLLAACELALEQLHHCDCSNGVTSPMGDIDEGNVWAGQTADTLLAAIRKAKGESPG